jgi:TM2 domain-containing membrane protein YozV
MCGYNADVLFLPLFYPTADRYSTGYRFDVAMYLSMFLGVFGIDRFYLGYPAIGLLKLSTFGGFLIGYWIDFILISAQVSDLAKHSEGSCSFGSRPVVLTASPEHEQPQLKVLRC